MQVRAFQANGLALCAVDEPRAAERPINCALLDAPPAIGDWLLVHVDVAIRAIDAQEAREIGNALAAVSAAAAGEPFEHLLGDLIDREPQLPPHLRDGGSP
jgi:hydrogenase expression/formation protein HypC